MQQAVSFGEILEAVDQLSSEEQETLIEIVCRRMAERGRRELVADIHEAQQEFAEARCRPATMDEIMNNVLS